VSAGGCAGHAGHADPAGRTGAGPVGSDPAAPTVRRMRWWDVPALLPLERASFGTDAWTEAGFWSELAGWPETRHYVVAEVPPGEPGEPGGSSGPREGGGPGAVVHGFGGLLVAADEATVQTLAVDPAWRGCGLGRLLLEDLLAEAGHRGAASVWLEVRADNAAALGLYDRFGFERAGVRRGYYAQGRVDAVVMRRRVRVPAGPGARVRDAGVAP